MFLVTISNNHGLDVYSDLVEMWKGFSSFRGLCVLKASDGKAVLSMCFVDILFK